MTFENGVFFLPVSQKKLQKTEQFSHLVSVVAVASVNPAVRHFQKVPVIREILSKLKHEDL